MLLKIKSNIFFKSCLIGLFGTFSALLLALGDFLIYDISTLKSALEQNMAGVVQLLILSGVFSFFVSFIAFFVGSKFSEKLNLTNRKIIITKKEIGIAAIIVILIPFILKIIDILLYKNNITGYNSFTVSGLLSGIFYNGILEEIWFRFGFMTLFIFAFYKVFGKNKVISKKYYIIGLVFVSLFLFGWQLLGTFEIYYFNLFLFLRVILLYFCMSIIYGFVFLKKGLKYSILLHILFVINYMGIMPLIFGLVLKI